MEDQRRAFCWLASYPKSGNTWVRMFLAHYLNDGHQININALPRRLKYYDLRPMDYYNVSPFPLTELEQADTIMLRNAVLLGIAMETKRWHPVPIKTHNAFVELMGQDLMPGMLTDRAVYIARDPRDVAVSFARHTNNEIDHIVDIMGDDAATSHDKDASHALFHYLASWNKHVESWLRFDSKKPLFLLRYEDMLEKPKESFSTLVEFLQWDLDEDVLDRAIFNSSFDRLKAQETKHGFEEKPEQVDGTFFRSGRAGAWEDILSPEQVEKIEKACGPMMKELDYL